MKQAQNVGAQRWREAPAQEKARTRDVRLAKPHTLAAPELSRIDGGLRWIVKPALGGTFGGILLCATCCPPFLVCALAVHAGAVRLMFAMARDRFLPFSRALSHVLPASCFGRFLQRPFSFPEEHALTGTLLRTPTLCRAALLLCSAALL